MTNLSQTVRQRPSVWGPVGTLLLLGLIVVIWLLLQPLTNLPTLALPDLLFVVTAVLFNWLVVGIYIANRRQHNDLVQLFGAGFMSLTLPLTVVFFSYLSTGKEPWVYLGFAVISLYLLIELLFDYVWKIPFREMLLLHIAYILLFYAALASLIVIAFSIDRGWGYAVSVSFWALLGSLVYLLVGQGKARSQTDDTPELHHRGGY